MQMYVHQHVGDATQILDTDFNTVPLNVCGGGVPIKAWHQ